MKTGVIQTRLITVRVPVDVLQAVDRVAGGNRSGKIVEMMRRCITDGEVYVDGVIHGASVIQECGVIRSDGVIQESKEETGAFEALFGEVKKSVKGKVKRVDKVAAAGKAAREDMRLVDPEAWEGSGE